MSQAHTTGKVLAGTVGAVGLLLATGQAANAASITVKPNDTVWGLAQQHGVSVKSIEKLNQIKALNATTDLIYVGQKLQINGAAEQTATTNKKGTYTVKSGDSLWALADRFHTSVRALQQMNGLHSNLILVGQVLTVPGNGTTAPVTSTRSTAVTPSTTKTVTPATTTTYVATPTQVTSAAASQAPVSAVSTQNTASQGAVSASAQSTSTATSVATSTASQATSDAATSTTSQATSDTTTNASATSESTTDAASTASNQALAAPSVAPTVEAYSDNWTTTDQTTTSQASSQSTASSNQTSASSQSSSSQATSTADQSTTSQSQVTSNQSSSSTSQSASTSQSTTTNTSTSTADQSNSTTSQSTSSSSSSSSQSSSSTATSNSSSESSTSSSSNLTTGSVTGLAVQLASANIPYVWGGSSLSGMDCSGLVAYVYQHADGISLPHNTVAQEAYVTTHSVESAQPGDILFWGARGATYHNAIYIGNNQYVAAPTEGQNVQIETISSSFMPSFAGTLK